LSKSDKAQKLALQHWLEAVCYDLYIVIIAILYQLVVLNRKRGDIPLTMLHGHDYTKPGYVVNT